MNMDPFIQAISRIIREQQAIVGPLALDQARKVEGLDVTTPDDIKITGNKKQTLDNLINQYAKLFGQASVEVCRQAFQPFSDKIPAAEVPDILKN